MKSISPSVLLALTKSLRDGEVQLRDEATVALAKRYAALIEAAPESQAVAVTSDLGPKLLACLNALGMNPAARATSGGAPVGRNSQGDALARLRAQRSAARAH